MPAHRRHAWVDFCNLQGTPCHPASSSCAPHAPCRAPRSSLSPTPTRSSDCAAAAGTYLTGVVVAAPTFQRGKKLRGVELSHTHIALVGAIGAKRYDIAVDDVYASGYLPRHEVVPAPRWDRIRVGARLSLCGIAYRGGMHWVHANCGDKPTPQDPDGWLKEIASDGTVGPNLEASTTYCYLWRAK